MSNKTYNRNVETEFSRKIWVAWVWLAAIAALFLNRAWEINGWFGR